jgi:hypothetical protein
MCFFFGGNGGNGGDEDSLEPRTAGMRRGWRNTNGRGLDIATEVGCPRERVSSGIRSLQYNNVAAALSWSKGGVQETPQSGKDVSFTPPAATLERAQPHCRPTTIAERLCLPTR